jgi:hypothetical protein
VAVVAVVVVAVLMLLVVQVVRPFQNLQVEGAAEVGVLENQIQQGELAMSQERQALVLLLATVGLVKVLTEYLIQYMLLQEAEVSGQHGEQLAQQDALVLGAVRPILAVLLMAAVAAV